MQMSRQELAEFCIKWLEKIRQKPATEQEKARIHQWCETVETLPHKVRSRERPRVGNLSPSELRAIGEKEIATRPEIVTNQIRTLSRINNISVEQEVGEMIVCRDERRICFSEMEKYGRLTDSDRKWFKRIWFIDWPTKYVDTGRKYPEYG
jgi:hypothetical protein